MYHKLKVQCAWFGGSGPCSASEISVFFLGGFGGGRRCNGLGVSV